MPDKLATPEFLIDGLEQPGATVALAHGTTAGMDSDFMNQVAHRLAGEGLRVMRFEFPYMAEWRRTGKAQMPDSKRTLRKTWRKVIEQLGAEGLVIGGKSMGAHIASMVADESGVAGVVCLGYPFHPEGKPEKVKIDHLRELRTPMLIVQGEQAGFGRRSEVEEYDLPDNIQIHWIAGSDQDFKSDSDSPTAQDERFDEAVAAVVRFVAQVAPDEAGEVAEWASEESNAPQHAAAPDESEASLAGADQDDYQDHETLGTWGEADTEDFTLHLSDSTFDAADDAGQQSLPDPADTDLEEEDGEESASHDGQQAVHPAREDPTREDPAREEAAADDDGLNGRPGSEDSGIERFQSDAEYRRPLFDPDFKEENPAAPSIPASDRFSEKAAAKEATQPADDLDDDFQDDLDDDEFEAALFEPLEPEDGKQEQPGDQEAASSAETLPTGRQPTRPREQSHPQPATVRQPSQAPRKKKRISSRKRDPILEKLQVAKEGVRYAGLRFYARLGTLVGAVGFLCGLASIVFAFLQPDFTVGTFVAPVLLAVGSFGLLAFSDFVFVFLDFTRKNRSNFNDLAEAFDYLLELADNEDEE